MQMKTCASMGKRGGERRRILSSHTCGENLVVIHHDHGQRGRIKREGLAGIDHCAGNIPRQLESSATGG